MGCMAPALSVNNKIKTGKYMGVQVLLLCGPPGLGKTTLAHVAARHCEYRVVEVNYCLNFSAIARL